MLSRLSGSNPGSTFARSLYIERSLDISYDPFGEREDAHANAGIPLRILPRHPPGDSVHFSLSLTQRDVRFEASHDAEVIEAVNSGLINRQECWMFRNYSPRT